MAQDTQTQQTGSKGQSAAISPVVLAWEIAFEMIGAEQKDVVRACIDAGITPGTAKTQISRFFNQQRDPEYSWN
jgi:hypothetical protein